MANTKSSWNESITYVWNRIHQADNDDDYITRENDDDSNNDDNKYDSNKYNSNNYGSNNYDSNKYDSNNYGSNNYGSNNSDYNNNGDNNDDNNDDKKNDDNNYKKLMTWFLQSLSIIYHKYCFFLYWTYKTVNSTLQSN